MPLIRFISTLVLSSVILIFQANAQDAISSVVSQPKTISEYDKLVSDLRYKNPDSALYFATNGLNLAKQNNDHNGIAKMLNQQGMIQDNMGMFEESRKKYLESIAHYRKTGNQKGVASEIIRLGVVEMRKGNYDKAIGFFLNSLKISELIKNEPGQMEAYCTLAESYMAQRKYDTALNYLQTAESYNNTVPFWSISLNVYNNFGVSYRELGKFDSAKIYLNKGIKLSSPAKYQGLFITLNNNLASVYNRQGSTQKAIRLLLISLSKARQIRNYLRELQTLTILAETYNKLNTQQALYYYRLALKLATDKKAYKQQIEILDNLSSLYKLTGEYKTALQLKEQQNALSDSVFYKAMSKQIISLQAQYELYKSKESVQKLKLENAQQLLRYNVILSVCGTIVLILFFTIFLAYKSRKLNILLNRANHKLTDSNAVKDKLFSVLAHDLRSPLSSVIGLLYLLEEGDLTETRKKDLIHKLGETCHASLETLNNLLRWGEMQLKGVRLNSVKFNPGEAIQRNISLLSGSAKEKSIVIDYKIPSEIQVCADPDHFDFVVRNLLSNAIKFTPSKGSVHISAIPVKNSIRFMVRDNGIGIAEKRLAEIFNMTNVSTNGTNNETGTSLGLFMCKEFAEANNGNISVKSELGKGSEFVLTLPGTSQN